MGGKKNLQQYAQSQQVANYKIRAKEVEKTNFMISEKSFINNDDTHTLPYQNTMDGCGWGELTIYICGVN